MSVRVMQHSLYRYLPLHNCTVKDLRGCICFLCSSDHSLLFVSVSHILSALAMKLLRLQLQSVWVCDMDRQTTDEDTKDSDEPLLDLEAGHGLQPSTTEYSLSCIWSEIV